MASKLQTRFFLTPPCPVCRTNGHVASAHVRIPRKEFPRLYETVPGFVNKRRVKRPFPGAVVVARMLSTPQWRGSLVEIAPDNSYTVAHPSGAIARIKA